MSVVALGGTGIPPGALRALGDGVVQALGQAALGARSLARVAAALVAASAHEVVVHAFAARVTGANADVSTARAARSALELVAVLVRARDTLVDLRALGAFGHRILGQPRPALVAALAPGGGACVAAALATPLTGESVAVLVLAAEVPLGLADVATALPVAAREKLSMAVDAR